MTEHHQCPGQGFVQCIMNAMPPWHVLLFAALNLAFLDRPRLIN